MRLYIIRHADPDYEKDTITADGHKEAEALARRFAAVGFDRIYCSPLGRAKATMKYTTDLLRADYNVENWTKELWPEMLLEGSPWGDIMAIDVPGENYRCEDGLPTHENWHQCTSLKKYTIREAFDAVRKNSDDFLERHGYVREGGRYRVIRPNEDRIAVFCHAGFGLTWLAHLLEIPVTLVWSGFWVPPSSVTTVLFEERTPGWAVPRCIGLGDVSHLYEAGLPVKTMGLKANIE